MPLSAEVLDAAFEHVADRLAARGCHERPNGAGDDGAVCDPFALNEWGRRMARANIGKTDLSDISLLKSEIFAIVFRWIGQGEIAVEGAYGFSLGRKQERWEFLFQSAVTH